MARILVAHGFNAWPEKNWFPWLKKQYRPGIVSVPAMPKPTAARRDEWMQTLGEALGAPDGDTVLVGHSLGCITALRTLEAAPQPWTLRGLVLVSGFYETVDGVPALDEFVAGPVDAGLIIRSVPQRQVVASDDDTDIVPEMTERLAALLEAPLLTVPGAGHFSERTGVKEVPALLPVLDAMLGDDLAEAIAPSRAVAQPV